MLNTHSCKWCRCNQLKKINNEVVSTHVRPYVIYAVVCHYTTSLLENAAAHIERHACVGWIQKQEFRSSHVPYLVFDVFAGLKLFQVCQNPVPFTLNFSSFQLRSSSFIFHPFLSNICGSTDPTRERSHDCQLGSCFRRHPDRIEQFFEQDWFFQN